MYDALPNLPFIMKSETISIVTDVVDKDKNIPGGFVFHQNYPNPFNPSTVISWRSSVSSRQTLKIYDVLGNEIATIVDEYKPAGEYEIIFNLGAIHRIALTSGIYFYQLRVGEFT